MFRFIKLQFMVISISLLSFLSVACTPPKEKPKSKPSIPVKSTFAKLKDIPIQINSIGTVEPIASVAIKSQVNGQIAKIHFVEGSDVTKGALLASIDPAPFQANLRQAEALLAKDLAQEKFANEQYKRYEQLLKDGIVTRDQYDLIRSNADSLAATVAADRAAIKNARIQLEYCSIRSPISGRTGAIAIQVGNLVKANDLPIVTVNQISPIAVTFATPENRLSEIKRAMASNQLKVQAIISGLPQESETGKVFFLDNSVNAATGTIKLKGVFANKSGKLWPGQFADIVLTVAMRTNSVVVPMEALQTGQQGEFVYVIGTDKKAEMRPVTAITIGDEALIEKGLLAGETVVIDGQLRLTPGALVQTSDKQAKKDKNL